MADRRKFMHLATKSHCILAEKLSTELRDVISAYEEKIPLALAIGVLRIVEKELLNE